MIKCIFTVDYEIYGNGEGSLIEQVYEPAERLKALFHKWNVPFVLFVEVAELEMIDAEGKDEAVHLVKQQVLDFYKTGFEIGLHIHPQWYNAQHKNGIWLLDYSQYNLCVLPRGRIAQIFSRAIAYLRKILGVADFTPISFRAGNWLFQPSEAVAEALIELGIKIDSSVFKGGLQHQHNLDYRRTHKNGYYWPFSDDVCVADRQGALMEFPIYTRMVRTWEMLTAKRIGLSQKSPVGAVRGCNRFLRLLDFVRFKYPLKFDFCKMTLDELMSIVEEEIQKDQQNPEKFIPITAIGHTKDLFDLETVDAFLAYLHGQKISISTFRDMYTSLKC